MPNSPLRSMHCLLACAALVAPPTLAEARELQVNRPVQVSLSFSIVIPSADATTQGSLSVSENTRKAIYELATSECRLLLATIASSCQLTNVSVNINEQRHHQPTPYIQVNGSGSYAITLKAN